MRLRKAFLWSMIVSLSLTAVLGIAALLLPGFRRWSEEILVSSLLVGGFSLACLICAIVLSKRRLVPAMWVGIVAALCALAVWLVLTWWSAIIGPGQWRQWGSLHRSLEKMGVQFTTVMGWALFIGLLVLPRVYGRGPRGARALAFVLATMLALFTTTVVWFDFDGWWVFRLFGTFAILFGWNLWSAMLLLVRLDRARHARVRLITICIGAALVVWSLAGVEVKGRVSARDGGKADTQYHLCEGEEEKAVSADQEERMRDGQAGSGDTQYQRPSDPIAQVAGGQLEEDDAEVVDATQNQHLLDRKAAAEEEEVDRREEVDAGERQVPLVDSEISLQHETKSQCDPPLGRPDIETDPDRMLHSPRHSGAPRNDGVA